LGKLFNIINEEKAKLRMLDPEVRNALLAKVGVSALAVFIGLIFLIICVYVIIPSIISGAADSIDLNRARRMYESTLINQAPDTKPAFVQPGEAPVQKPRDIFAAALAENPDVVGRISIDGIGIAYLVVQSNDNEYYLENGYSGEASRMGAVFLDYRCGASPGPLSGHYIVYGHNMKSGAMFHNLLKYKDKYTFYSNRIIRFDTLYDDHEWEIFSAYTTADDFYFIDTAFRDDSEWLAFLRAIQDKSMFDTDTSLSPDDVVLTLSTCTNASDSERFVVHAKLIK
jgi:sortase B